MNKLADRSASTRVGLIGAGWVGTNRHLPSLARLDHVSVVAIADPDEARARKVAVQFGAKSSFSDTDAFLDCGLDAVFICTPPWTHAELAIKALDHGIHVFTEKPMATSVADAEAMLEASRRNDRVLCVSHNFLFSRSVLRADDWLGGADVRYAMGLQASSPARRLPTWIDTQPAGLFCDESPHLLYTLQHFLGALELDDVRVLPSLKGHAHPRSIELLVQGPRGAGQVTMLFEAPVSEWHVGLMGDDQVIDLDLFRDIAVRMPSDGEHKARDIARSSARVIGGHIGGFVTSGARLLAKRQAWGHDVVIAKFIDAIRGNAPTPVPAEESVSIVRLTDQILAEVLGGATR